MKKQLSLLAGICFTIHTLTAQQAIKPNTFKIGIFGSSYKTHLVNGCEVAYTVPVDSNGYKTSTLTICAEDGFNIHQTYEPNGLTTEETFRKRILLTQANAMQIEIAAVYTYKPSIDTNGHYAYNGTNVFDNCGNSITACQSPFSRNYFRADVDNYLAKIYTISPYKDIIWGYHISEESAYYHNCQYKCEGNDYPNPAYFKAVEIPPVNVGTVISHYKSILSAAGIQHHKIVVMEANHHKSINATTNDGEGIYNPQEYIQLLNKNDTRDVFFEGSYAQFPATDWRNQKYSAIALSGYHYLGAFKSIEYAKNFSDQVHKVINIEGTLGGAGYAAHLHSNTEIQNANWLWFQTYTSIIHGVDGIWFWDLNYTRNIQEPNNFGNNTLPDRYERIHFPSTYKNYVGYLAKELRFLVNENIISTDPASVVATKTDVQDSNGIVPAAASYIPGRLPKEKRTEQYGLRYTIRTNGTETYMIITNPLNVAIRTKLDFSQASDTLIQRSVGVQVLFDTNQFSVKSSGYHVDRNSNINLPDGTVESQYYIPYLSNKRLPLSFGPMDVKILKFTSKASTL